jgi:hypothetical protein
MAGASDPRTTEPRGGEGLAAFLEKRKPKFDS